MATLLRTSMTDHSTLDDTGDDINGSEVDENSYVLSDVLDGTTQTDLASADRVDVLSTSTHSTSREGLRIINLDAATGAVQDVFRLEWDPASGTPANSQGIGMVWRMSDSVGNQDEFAAIDVVVTDVTSGSEDARMDFSLVLAGTSTSILQLNNTTLNPTTNDGVALGTTSLGFSDLHLATGGVINWANGEVTLTETDANTLTLAGGTMSFASGVTVSQLLATANDSGALGASGTAFSDLFLASGGVINWNAGDVTITHSANALALAGASSGYTVDAVLSPATNDAAALGTTSLGWADLHLATGGVINWANGEITITETDANTLTITGGAVVLDGTYSAPFRLGTKRIWHDATNDVIRVKNSAPSSETDGNFLAETAFA